MKDLERSAEVLCTLGNVKIIIDFVLSEDFCLRLSIIYSSHSIDQILELYDKQSRSPEFRKEVDRDKQYQ